MNSQSPALQLHHDTSAIKRHGLDVVTVSVLPARRGAIIPPPRLAARGGDSLLGGREACHSLASLHGLAGNGIPVTTPRAPKAIKAVVGGIHGPTAAVGARYQGFGSDGTLIIEHDDYDTVKYELEHLGIVDTVDLINTVKATLYDINILAGEITEYLQLTTYHEFSFDSKDIKVQVTMDCASNGTYGYEVAVLQLNDDTWNYIYRERFE